MTAEDIPALIASARESAAFEIDELGDDAFTGQLLISLADTLEAEHQQATKWQKLWEKAANGVLSLQAERDALTKKLRQIDEFATWGTLPIPTRDRIRNILSRAIDTKEQS